MLSEGLVRAQFAPWETSNPLPFFDILADNVYWIVSGKLNPLSGAYNSKNEVLDVFGRLTARFAGPPTSKITNVLTSGDYAVVEMTLHAVSKGGNDFDEQLCWVCRYEGEKCVSVMLYVDSAAEKQLFEE